MPIYRKDKKDFNGYKVKCVKCGRFVISSEAFTVNGNAGCKNVKECKKALLERIKNEKTTELR